MFATQSLSAFNSCALCVRYLTTAKQTYANLNIKHHEYHHHQTNSTSTGIARPSFLHRQSAFAHMHCTVYRTQTEHMHSTIYQTQTEQMHCTVYQTQTEHTMFTPASIKSIPHTKQSTRFKSKKRVDWVLMVLPPPSRSYPQIKCVILVYETCTVHEIISAYMALPTS